MKHNSKVTLILIGTFLVAQFLGLYIVFQHIDLEQTKVIGKPVFKEPPTIGGVSIDRPDIPEATSYIYFFLAILFGTGLLLLLIRFRWMVVWKLWYGFAITTSLLFAFSAFIPDLFALVLAIFLAIWKILRPNVFIHNISEVFLYGGLAAIFVPVVNVNAAIILLILISIYDMYAVWKSKHMIKLAEFQSKSKMFAGFLIPYEMPRIISQRTYVKKKFVQTAVLGGGDVGFPLIFGGVLLKTNGWLPAVLVVLGAAVGLAFLLFFSKKDRFYPAMPFISIGCFLGYILFLIL